MKRFRFVPFVLIVALFSCGLNNTMYNAKKYFKSAQDRPLNTNGRPTPQAIADYTLAIQKCGIIITERKNSKIMDDALFLMAKALYFKGNSAFQAKDQFEALITGFPDSKHVPEAHIFLARVHREINQPQQAEKLLEEFVRNPRYRAHHPQALLVLTEFEILDKDYYRAQFWLEKIISEYPDTKQYGAAFFLFGRNYYVQKDYKASLDEFEKLIGIRRLDKDLKLDARYYIALNHFYLKHFDQSERMVASLLKDEARPDKLALVRLLLARLHFARGKYDEGIAEIDDIGKTTARTAAAAEAYYYLGEFHFYIQNDITKATAAYNRVRTEFPNSEFVPIAQSKVAALNQLKQNQNLSVKTNLQQFVDYHVLSAEKYYDPMALPDSTLAMYQRLVDADIKILAERDSLQALVDDKQAKVDSLSLIPWEESIPEADTLKAAIADTVGTFELEQDTIEAPDTMSTVAVSISEETEADTLLVVDVAETGSAENDSLSIDYADAEAIPPVIEPADTLMVAELDAAVPSETDSLYVIDLPDVSAEIADTLSTIVSDTLSTLPEQETPEIPRNPEIVRLEGEITALQTRITALDDILKRLYTDVIPLAYFAQASLYNKIGDNEDQIAAIYDTMHERFPLNKYTNALRALREGNPVRLVDPIEEAQELRLDNALGLAESAPDSMRVILEELAVSDYAHIRLKANFRLGWHYSIETQDTTAAKPYLDAALKLEQSGDYATLIRKIYDGTSFVFNRPRPVPDSLKADESATEEEKEKAETELEEDAQKPDPEEIIADVDEADKPRPEDEIPPPEPQIDDEKPTDAEPPPLLPEEEPIPEDETPPPPLQPVIPPLE